jgi:hypothetical protein
MLDCLLLLTDVVRAALRSRSEVVAENLLLRHQLMVLSRPTRKRPRLTTHDRLVWLVARRLLRDWRRHLVLVRPETVVRWHARAWGSGGGGGRGVRWAGRESAPRCAG